MLDSSVIVGSGQRTLLPGHAREPGHHGGLQGVQSVMVVPDDGPLPSSVASTGLKTLIWTPWRPPWWPGPQRRVLMTWWERNSFSVDSPGAPCPPRSYHLGVHSLDEIGLGLAADAGRHDHYQQHHAKEGDYRGLHGLPTKYSRVGVYPGPDPTFKKKPDPALKKKPDPTVKTNSDQFWRSFEFRCSDRIRISNPVPRAKQKSIFFSYVSRFV